MDASMNVYVLTWLSWLLPLSVARDILLIIMIIRIILLDGVKRLNEIVDKEDNKTE